LGKGSKEARKEVTAAKCIHWAGTADCAGRGVGFKKHRQVGKKSGGLAEVATSRDLMAQKREVSGVTFSTFERSGRSASKEGGEESDASKIVSFLQGVDDPAETTDSKTKNEEEKKGGREDGGSDGAGEQKQSKTKTGRLCRARSGEPTQKRRALPKKPKLVRRDQWKLFPTKELGNDRVEKEKISGWGNQSPSCAR